MSYTYRLVGQPEGWIVPPKTALRGFSCPYCGKFYGTDRCDAGTGQTILCCCELHCEPCYEEPAK